MNSEMIEKLLLSRSRLVKELQPPTVGEKA